MANQSPRPILPIKVPVNYPTTPSPEKIRILYDANKHDIYHKLSPYGYDTFFGIKSRHPFVYTYPDEAKNSSDMYVVDLFNRSIADVKRVSKFMISGQGILFMGKQFLMQTGNAFNETRIWNPTSPIVSAGMGIALWAVRPRRHVDTGDLLGSFLGSAGSSIRSIFTNAPPAPPVGTVGRSALPTNSPANGKGLLRAGTANAAKTTLTNRWQVQNTKGLGLGGFIGSFIKSTFGNFLPQRQTGIEYRADEKTYGLMLASGVGNNAPFSYYGTGVNPIKGAQQFWFGGTSGGIRDGGQIPANWTLIYIDERGKPMFKKPSASYRISGLRGNVGFDPQPTDIPAKYGEAVGVQSFDVNGKMDRDWKNSNLLIQHSLYADEKRKYPSKLTDKQSPTVKDIKESLQQVINKIQNASAYEIEQSPQSSIVRFNQEKIGYDRIVAMKNPSDKEMSYKHSVLEEYRERNIRTLERIHNGLNSMKMASTNQTDGINELGVQENKWEVWKPYKDDIIAFYFYDVVNDKYIPFRATIRGLQETDSANWEELSFIGRADRLYSYSGYNRSLAFSFTINISSIMELAPTWQRINYLMSLVKPANYTVNPHQPGTQNIHTRYIVPPMVMVTIGDMYKNQPVVIGSAGLSVPDNALWETLNTENSPNGWSYLANYIKAPRVGKMYAQLPKTVDISLTAYIIEKERAMVGTAHFGHAPHDETYTKDVYRRTIPDFSTPDEFSKNLVVYTNTKAA